MINKNGKLFSKISIVDILIVVVIVGLMAGVVYKNTKSAAAQTIKSDKVFYVTFVAEKFKESHVPAIKVGDVYYVQYENILGKAVDVKVDNAYEVMKKNDGTVVYALVEKKKNVYITVECMGNVNEFGYYSNGTKQLANGMDITMKSSTVTIPAKVFKTSMTLD